MGFGGLGVLGLKIDFAFGIRGVRGLGFEAQSLEFGKLQ